MLSGQRDQYTYAAEYMHKHSGHAGQIAGSSIDISLGQPLHRMLSALFGAVLLKFGSSTITTSDRHTNQSRWGSSQLQMMYPSMWLPTHT